MSECWVFIDPEFGGIDMLRPVNLANVLGWFINALNITGWKLTLPIYYNCMYIVSVALYRNVSNFNCSDGVIQHLFSISSFLFNKINTTVCVPRYMYFRSCIHNVDWVAAAAAAACLDKRNSFLTALATAEKAIHSIYMSLKQYIGRMNDAGE